MEQYRILVTGTHGVGKTTLVDDLRSELSDFSAVRIVPEPARIVASMGFKVNDKISIEGIKAYLNVYETNFIEASEPIVIHDRCILDLYAYTEHLYSRKGRFSPQLGRLILDRAKLDLLKFDLVVFVPAEFRMNPDEIRPSNQSFRDEVEARILRFLEQLEVSYISVTGSRTNRTNRVIQELRLCSKLRLNQAKVELMD